MPEENGNRSPTETLIHCLDDFGTDEPLGVLVIWKTKEDLCWSRDSSLTISEAIGALECVKAAFLEDWKKTRRGEQ